MADRVLIVDDDKAVREFVASLIQAMDLSPVIASNGVDALMKFSTEGPDHFLAAIIDLSMPQMNGQELLAHLKQTNPAILTVLCSGLPDMVASNGKTGGFDAVIRKPFTAEDFRARFAWALNEKNSAN